MVEPQRKRIQTNHKIKCYNCKEFKTFPNFKFTGKGHHKKGIPGAYRKDICLSCDKNN